MSNEILNEGFFNNKNIPVCEKVGLIALLLGGTCEKNALSFDGKTQAFFSMVYKRGGSNAGTPVVFTYGHPETMSDLNAIAVIHSMGVDDDMAKKIVSGTANDKETGEYLAELYKTNPNIDKTKFGENFEKLILPKIQAYLTGPIKGTDSYIADNPKIIDNIIEVCKDVNMNDKKKQMTEQVAQSTTNN